MMESFKIGELIEVRINLILFKIIIVFFFIIIKKYIFEFRKRGQKIMEKKIKIGLTKLTQTILGMISFSFAYHARLKN